MKGVMLEVPEHILEERRISGADQWDEVWDAVLHLNPPPNVEHQDFEGRLETWLRQHWVQTEDGNRVLHQVALSPDENWVHNYRTPDIVLLRASHARNLQPTHCHGPCTVAVEIRSPNDETYEKFDFYAGLKVPELWVIDRDDRRPEIHALNAGRYHLRKVDPSGWITSQAANVQLKQSDQSLVIRIAGDDDTRRTIPD